MRDTAIGIEQQRPSPSVFQMPTSEPKGVGVAPGGTGVQLGELAVARETKRVEEREARVSRWQYEGPQGNIDAGLLRKATQIIESIEAEDAYQAEILLTALAGTVSEMWESADRSSETHQDILASLENAARLLQAAGTVTGEQLGAVREAIHDLGMKHLVREHAETIRAGFVDVGFAPFGFLEPDHDGSAT